MHLARRKALCWPKTCKLAHAFMWGYIDKRLKLAQIMDKLGIILTYHGLWTRITALRSLGPLGDGHSQAYTPAVRVSPTATTA